MKGFSFITVRRQDYPPAKHFLSVHYGDLVFRSGYLWSEGRLQYRAVGIRQAYSAEVNVALPRNELVYLSGPFQLNICLGTFFAIYEKGYIEEFGGSVFLV